MVYEFAVTLDQEIAVVWKRKFTATSLLLLSIRWLMVLAPILGCLNAIGQAWCE
ncbi:uncharacterized protein PHACADRAFT_253302 [Phanerochaete carnosa HHB-10118-sp]|uniref:DUF6533 domain-containing protein n=1 Tax=Phanerochaete carnosa (strain HHB-10118-sp) TaxID=650164 RepID=K5WAN0_PHACS|nr:uncharacterized protein PHACADRAFT_253302 [Phanerochaete carnosa HHB-10118-sp]EKM56265.1 hypothetical protein PHACADRAFT_253302 [Phanerochaete carnosa HHB-10118-sp]